MYISEQLKGNLFYFGSKHLTQLGSGPLLFFLSLSHRQIFFMVILLHILYGYHVPFLLEIIPQTRIFLL